MWRLGVMHSVKSSHLEARQVRGLEVVGRAAAPVHDVLVLALASQFAVPVGEPQVVVHHGAAVGAVLQHGVEERLGAETRTERVRTFYFKTASVSSSKMKAEPRYFLV